MQLLRAFRLSLVLTVLTLSLSWMSVVAHADPYGSGIYGDCPYSGSCPVSNPPSQPTPPPTTTDPAPEPPADQPTNTTSEPVTEPTSEEPSQDNQDQSPTNYPVTGGTSSGGNSSSGGSTKPPIEHRITPEDFGGEVYQSIGRAIATVPAPVAYSFPYLIFLLALLLIIRLFWQTQHELRRIAVIADTSKREKELALEKENFMMLASHYLRTPLTIIKGNLELLQSLKTLTAEDVSALQQQIAYIQDPAEAMLTKLSENKVFNAMPSPATAGVQSPLRSLLSPAVLVPASIGVLLIIAIQFMLVDFQVISPSIIDFLVQLGLAALLVQLFVSRFRARQIKRANKQDKLRLLNEQRELDHARSELIEGIATTMNDAVLQLGTSLSTLQQQGKDVSKLQPGFGQLQNIAEKFRLASQLEAQAVQLGKIAFPSSQLIHQVVTDNLELAKQKGVKIEVDFDQERTLQQNQDLLHMVVDALINNAVKFSTEDSVVRVVSDGKDPNNLHLEIQDTGPGLSKQQLASLFKPFSRAESAETFNTEGLGFSLYLAKLITHYLGGDITLDSKEGQGTLARIYVPAV